MIKGITMYTVICDNCGCDSCEHEEYSAWSDKDFAVQVATEADWIKEGDKHYCNDCYSYNDNDELVINEERKKIL